jgi:membrane-associated PAP2 superfamily phosphatase
MAWQACRRGGKVHPNFSMERFGKHVTIGLFVGLGMVVAAGSACGQELSGLPDDPGQALLRADAGESPADASKLPDAQLQTNPPAFDAQRPAVDTTTGVAQREATWRSMPGDFLHDQKDLWTFPLQLVRGHHLVPTLIVAGVTVGLIYADPHDMPYFRNHQKNWDDVNDVFDPMITTGEVIALPAGLLAAGYIRHDDREVNTALLATEAYGDSVVIDLAMKAVTRRERPSDVAPNGDYSDTFFNGGKSPLKGSSFPSGHATAVWSVATVVAERYSHRGKPWVPVLAYTLATAISISRITEAAHFPSDVWLGASLGYTIAKYQTLKPR